jgi:hypothetical protein
MRPLPEYFWSACAALLAMALLSGCGSTSAENASLAEKSLQTSNARIKIYRTTYVVAAGPAARVKVDGREIANLGVGGSTMLDVSAGSHKVEVDQWGHPNVFAMTLNAKPGMLYTLEISPRAEAAVAGIAFGLVGMFAEAAINENGGTFQIRVVDEKPIKG